MIKHTQTIRRWIANCLSVFDDTASFKSYSITKRDLFSDTYKDYSYFLQK